jgi:hypothetical protein
LLILTATFPDWSALWAHEQAGVPTNALLYFIAATLNLHERQGFLTSNLGNEDE